MYNAAMPLAFYARIDRPFEISSLQIGNVHFLNLPGEAVIEYQLYAQRTMPEAFVAVAAYGDCGCSYLCTDVQFEEGGYEPSDAWVGPGSEAALKKGIRHLLGLK